MNSDGDNTDFKSPFIHKNEDGNTLTYQSEFGTARSKRSLN